MRGNLSKQRLAVILTMFLFLGLTGCTAEKENVIPESVNKEVSSGRTVRVGCLESENYYFYTEQLDAMANVFSEKGWLDKGWGDKDVEGTAKIWDEISASDGNGGLIFERDAFFNYEEMDESAKDALKNRRDIDLLLVFGTAAGKWAADHSNEIAYDYMVFGSADPVTAGIVPDNTGRFAENSFAHVDPSRTGRQVDMAYRLFHFSDIGVVWEDSAEAYSYSGIRQLEERSEKYGFEIHTIHVDEPENTEDYGRYYEELKDAYARLIPKIDVLYITTGKIEDEKLPWLLEDVHKAGVITVAETQESQVEHGALVHITMSDPVQEGIFAAETVMEYMEGTPVNRLTQVYEITPKIVFNYDTARLLGVSIPMTTYLIADKIYPVK